MLLPHEIVLAVATHFYIKVEYITPIFTISVIAQNKEDLETVAAQCDLVLQQVYKIDSNRVKGILREKQ